MNTETVERAQAVPALLTETAEENIRRRMAAHEAAALDEVTDAELKVWNTNYARLTALLANTDQQP